MKKKIVKKADNRYCVVITFQSAEDAAEFINRPIRIIAGVRLFKATELAKGVKL